MSVTDELRSLLDEHGIEWWHDTDVSPDHTEWMTDRMAFTSLGIDGDMLAVKTISKMTPEQAIAATVGRGMCRTVLMDCFGNPPFNKSGLNGNDVVCGCSECGAPWGTTGLFRGNKIRHNFKACPICGRTVQDGQED